MEKILIQSGARAGRTFNNEADFIVALTGGKQVFTARNGIYFEVLRDGEGVRYVALTEKPEGI